MSAATSTVSNSSPLKIGLRFPIEARGDLMLLISTNSRRPSLLSCSFSLASLEKFEMSYKSFTLDIEINAIAPDLIGIKFCTLVNQAV